MKHLLLKYILICILFFLCAPFIRAQNFENKEQIDSVYIEQIDSVYQEKINIDTIQFYIRNAQYKQAIELIDSMEPTKELLYQKSLCCRYLNNNSNAIEILNSLSEEYPDDIPIKLQLALCYEAVAQFSKSIDCYDNLLKADSTNIYFEMRKADLLYRAEKYSLALDAYSRIDSTYNPNYITRCIAMCYEKLNQQVAAKNYFGKAWNLNELDAYSANSLVKINIKEENYLSAHVDSEKFIGIDSTNATMNALNAFVYYNLDYYDEAIERFEKCMQEGDSSLLVNRSLGLSYYLTEKDSLAKPLLQQAFLQDTTNTNVLYALGKVYFRLGYYPEAVECYQAIIDKIVPSDVLLYGVHKNLALSYEKDGAFEDAIKTYQTALRYTQNNSDKLELFYSMAAIYDKELKDYNSAVYFYKQYYTCLFTYQSSLKDERKINEIGTKLTELEEYIKFLTEEVEKNKN